MESSMGNIYTNNLKDMWYKINFLQYTYFLVFKMLYMLIFVAYKQ